MYLFPLFALLLSLEVLKNSLHHAQNTYEHIMK